MKGSTSNNGADKFMNWNKDKFESVWLVDGAPDPSWNGKWMNESGTAEASLILKPGRGYVVWIKDNNLKKLWTYPNPTL